MRPRALHPGGLSLVETTIILMVLGILTSVLAPSVNDFVNDAKDVKVKEDCEAIGTTVMRLVRDVGPCLRNLQVDPCATWNRTDILYSNGQAISLNDIDTSTAPDFSHPDIDGIGILNWDLGPVSGDTMESQFVLNLPEYVTPADVEHHDPLEGFRVPGPMFFLGWRGVYLGPQLGPDPHGLPYVVNSVFLSTANANATAGSGDGQKSGGWDRDVICLSAGRNRRFETPFGGNSTRGTARTGDDFVYVISGSTR